MISTSCVFGLSISAVISSSLLVLMPMWVRTTSWRSLNTTHIFPWTTSSGKWFLTVSTLRDVFLTGVMINTSAYMVIVLYRHQRECKHLHSIRHLRASPEKKATQTILLLVVFFVVMYWVDLIISSTSVLLWRYDPIILTVQKFVVNVYPTITPLVQISSDKRIINVLKNLWLKCHQTV